jgi:tetratricopeptide (TPR) repeat protein
MLETIRQYAHEKLTESGHLPALQSRHLDYFLQLAEEACPRAYEGNPAWLDRLETEHDNLRAALEHALAQDAELALRLAMSLDHFWLWHNHWIEGHAWATRLLPLTEAWGPGKLRARALGLAGSQAFDTPDDALARPLLEASLAMARMADDKYQMALSLYNLAWSANEAGDWAQVRRYAEESQVLFRELGIAWGVVNMYWVTGMAASGSGDYELARSLFEQTLKLARKENLPGLIVVTLNQLGDLAQRRGDYADAGVLFAECAQRNRQVRLNNILAVSLVKLGQVALHEGDHVRARPLFEEALTIYRQLELTDRFVIALAGLAGVAGVAGKHQQSARLFGAVEAIYGAPGWEMIPAARALYDRIIALVRSQLDEATFNAAWAEGRKMTLEQAIEYALESVKP